MSPLRPALLAALLLPLLTMHAPTPAAEPAATGITVAIGGALRPDNAAVWGRLVELAGGPGARFVVIATASSQPVRAAAEIVDALRRQGAQAEPLPVAAGPDGAQAVHDPALLARVAAARGVFFSGGEQARLLDALQPGGLASPLLEAIRALHRRGGVVAGTSAGAAVLSEVVFRDLPDPLSALKGRMRDGHELGRGFGLLPADVVVDQHFLKRGRIGRLLPLLVRQGLPLGLGVEEDSAAVVRGREVEAIGARGVLLIDVAQARSDAAQPAFNVRGVRLSFLAAGDRVDLDTRRFTPSAARLAGATIDPNAPGHAAARAGEPDGELFFPDILGDFTIVRAMTRLVDSPRREALGLAFAARPGPGDPAPELGFEWRLQVGDRTRAWPGPSGDDWSVADVLLDVQPVRMARPLYTPLAPLTPLTP